MVKREEIIKHIKEYYGVSYEQRALEHYYCK